jgi:hypothetical protein
MEPHDGFFIRGKIARARAQSKLKGRICAGARKIWAPVHSTTRFCKDASAAQRDDTQNAAEIGTDPDTGRR